MKIQREKMLKPRRSPSGSRLVPPRCSFAPVSLDWLAVIDPCLLYQRGPVPRLQTDWREMTELVIEHLRDLWLIDSRSQTYRRWWGVIAEFEELIYGKWMYHQGRGLGAGDKQIDGEETEEEWEEAIFSFFFGVICQGVNTPAQQTEEAVPDAHEQLWQSEDVWLQVFFSFLSGPFVCLTLAAAQHHTEQVH